MFKIIIPITKSFEKDSKCFVVEGIASDPSLDRDEERFDAAALTKMMGHVNAGGIPIRIEHENKIYTEIGKWTHAEMRDGDRLYVKGELDTELSLGKDMAVLLKRGETLSLSVGGKVNEAAFEFIKELNRSVKVYKDVDLSEISLVKHPSNYNTSLTMAKSVNWEKLEEVIKTPTEEKVPYTTKAQELIKEYKEMHKVSVEEFEKACAGGKKKMTQAQKVINAYKSMDTNNMEKAKGSKGQKMVDEGTAMMAEGKKIFGGKSGKGLKMVEDGQAMVDEGKKMMATEKTQEEIIEIAVNKYFDETVSDEDLEKEFDVLSDEEFEAVDKAIEDEENEVTKYGKPGRSGRKPGGGGGSAAHQQRMATQREKNRRANLSTLRSNRRQLLSGMSRGSSRAQRRSVNALNAHINRLGGKSVTPTWQDFKDQVTKSISEEVSKDWGLPEAECCVEETSEDRPMFLSVEDLKMMAKITAIMSQVSLPAKSEYPKLLNDNKFYSDLTEEQQIVLYDRSMVMPHHNADLSLNEDLLLWQLKDVIDYQSYWAPKNYAVIIDHLYRHLKELKLVKSAANIINQDGDMDKPKTPAPEVTKEVTTPEVVVETVVVTPEAEPSEVKVEESPAPAPEVVVETPAEAVVVETPKEEVPEVDTPVVEEKKEEVPTTVVEEVPAEKVEAVVTEVPDVVAPVVEPPAPEAVEPKEEVLEVAKSTDFHKAQMDSFEKSMTKMVTVIEGLSKKYEEVATVTKKYDALEVTVNKMANIVEKLSELPMRRKSVAIYSTIEKAFAKDDSEVESSEEEQVAKTMKEDNVPFGEAYKTVLATKRA